MAGRGLPRRIPNGLYGNLKMLERAAPGLDGVRRDQRIPVQFVDRRAAVLDGRQNSGQLGVLDMRVRAELQAVEAHGDSPGYAAAKRSGEKIRHFQAGVVDPVASAAGESRSMEVVVRQSDVLPGITAASFELAAGELAFSAQVHAPLRHHRLAQSITKIEQVDPAAIAKRPLRPQETVHFRLRIEMRASGAERALFERKAIAPEREFCRKTDGQWRVALRCELHGVPFQVAEI